MLEAMHIFFSGIGGAGIGPLALIAKQAGYDVSGSDIQPSASTAYLIEHGVKDIHIGQSREQIAKVHQLRAIDWFVYSSALERTDPHHPELVFAKRENIKATKRDELINQIIKDKGLKLVAVAGTHGKTTTTAMAVWLFKQLGLPVSYSVGAKFSFGEPGEFDPHSRYFIYEADEFDRNFLSFYPEVSLITGLDWDHPDIYSTRESYDQAFREFIEQSRQSVMWLEDAEQLGLSAGKNLKILDQDDAGIDNKLSLPGRVNRQDAWLVVEGLADEVGYKPQEALKHMEKFPGLSRRYEEIAPGIYSDYAHTPPKIRGALQLARERAGNKVIVIYEGLHNTRQHFIKDELANLFDEVAQLYVVPSYLARENPNLKILAPADLLNLLSNKARAHAHAARLDDHLAKVIETHVNAGDTVLAFSAGGAGSLDEWLRNNFS